MLNGDRGRVRGAASSARDRHRLGVHLGFLTAIGVWSVHSKRIELATMHPWCLDYCQALA